MKETIKVGIIGDYNEEAPTHIATNEALAHCAAYLGIKIEIHWISTELLESEQKEILETFDGLWSAPGSPYKSLLGALNGIQFARENNVPLLGTCGGFQHIILEYARNVLKIKDAQHAEYDPYASDLFVTPLTCSLAGKTFTIQLKHDSKVYQYYQEDEPNEKYYCNFGLNPDYQELLDQNGCKVVGIDHNGEARIIELEQHKFFIGTLFVPQTNSYPENPHKLILAYLKAVAH